MRTDKLVTTRDVANHPAQVGSGERQSRGDCANRELRFSQLSEARQRLVQSAHALDYGRFEHLVVEAGQPRLAPPCRAVRTRKYGGRPHPLPRLAPTSVLRAEWAEFFADLDELGSGEIPRLDIQAGLPFRTEMEVPMTELE